MSNITGKIYRQHKNTHFILFYFFFLFHRACCHIQFIKNQLMNLLQKTLFYIHIKYTKNLLKCSVKGVIIKPYMFRSLFHNHPQRSSFVLSAPTTYQPPASSFVFFGFVAVCPLFVCVRCTCALYLYVCPVYLSVCCLVVNSQFTTRQHTDRYTGHTYK
jgi:hypothetical protein